MNYFIWNHLDDEPFIFRNVVTYSNLEEAKDQLTDYMYGGLPLAEDIDFAMQWLSVEKGNTISGKGMTFNDKYIELYVV